MLVSAPPSLLVRVCPALINGRSESRLCRPLVVLASDDEEHSDVSPSARPRPSSAAARIPGAACGRLTASTASERVSPRPRAAWRWAAGTARRASSVERHDRRQDHHPEQDSGGQERIAAQGIEWREDPVDPVAQEENAEQSVDDGRDAGQQLDRRLGDEPPAVSEILRREDRRADAERSGKTQGDRRDRRGAVDHRAAPNSSPR